MPAPETPYQPYADVHKETHGPGDARPTALKVIEDCGMIGKLTEKTIAITGCSAGIGIETARALYEAGAKLILTARDMAKLNSNIDDIVTNAKHNKNGTRPIAVKLDLTSLASTREGAEQIKEHANNNLNILIENAGIMAVPYEKTVDGFEMHMGVNHFGHFLLFQMLKPLLLESAKQSGTASRVITVSSQGHSLSSIRFDDMHWNKDPGSYHKFSGYGQSKTANVYLASSIDRHYSSAGITGLSLHPGGILDTALGRHMTPEDWAVFGPLEQFQPILKNCEQGAATTVWAAVSPYFEGKNGGRYLSDVGEAGPLPSGHSVAAAGYAKHAYDEQSEEKLWKLSYEAVGLQED
ncbi:hypothetical protein LTR86_007122 [Recurvomyces mirabilis]|nr:hypothetical protein LTR86_007122 [Recurvomyces mirabilis]